MKLACDEQVSVPLGSLDRLMPMHLHLDARGGICGAGPTLRRILAENCDGSGFFDLFRVQRPAGVGRMADLIARPGQRIHLALTRREGVTLRGHAMPDGAGGALINLSFGIGIVDAVRTHALTIADFAPTDLTVEMLYLVEAKNAVLDEFRRLSLRLEGARFEAEEKALTDTLTGLRNRRALDRVLAMACEARQDFALMHLDLDKFKQVNDTRGHAAGDHILREVAVSLRAETRASDTVARIGGDEFVILLQGMTDLVALAALAARLVARLSRPILFEGEPCQIGASIGITVSGAYQAPDPAVMLHEADEALYEAKHAGRGNAKFAAAALQNEG